MSVQRIATRYAKSLIDLAQDNGKLDRVKEDVESFDMVCRNRDFSLLLKSPVVKPDKKQAIFNQLFKGKYDDLTMSFLNILLRKGREAQLTDIAKEFLTQYKVIRGISTVKLTTAVKLSDQAVEAIRQKLNASSTTRNTVEIITKVDPGIIGGFIIEYDDKLYDTSVSHKLDLLKKEFKDNLYISQIMA
jgi:F-type H+-transporting ATPase subunit delta